MIPIVSLLAALRVLTEAQTCNNGQGKLAFEKMSGYAFNYTRSTTKEIFNRDVFNSVDAPTKVLDECFRRCGQNELGPNSLDQFCIAFDLLPGERRSSPFQSSESNNQRITAHYEESKCILHTLNQNAFIGHSSDHQAINDNGSTLTNSGNTRSSSSIGDTSNSGDLNNEASNSISSLYSSALLNNEQHISGELIKQPNSWHFSPQCIKNRLINDCHRTYAFDRTAKHKLISVDIEMNCTNRLDCEERCLEQTNLPCRSISYDTTTMKCGLSKETRQSRPDYYKADPNSEYIENLCLSKNKICNFISFIAQRNRDMKGVLERELTVANDLFECAMLCVNSLEEKGFFCRTFSYDQAGQTCILYDEPSDIEIIENLDSITKISHGNLFTVQCLNAKEDEIWNNSLLELHHKKRLAGPHEVNIIANNSLQCMQECSKRFAYDCKMFEFSMKEQTCRFSGEYAHKIRTVSGSPHLTFDNIFDFYNVISIQSVNDALYQSPQYMMNHNSVYGTGNNMLNDVNYQLDPTLQFQTANLYKSAQNIPITQARNGLQHFNQFLNHHRGGYGYERHQSMLNNNQNPSYLHSNTIQNTGRQFNSLINDYSNHQQRNSFMNPHSPTMVQQRQSSNTGGLVYPSNYNGQQQTPNQQIVSNSNVHASSSQVSSSIQQAPVSLAKNNNAASGNLLSVSTNNHFNQIYPNNLMTSSAVNSPQPAFGMPYHSPISSPVLTLNTPTSSVQSNSISISSNPTPISQNMPQSHSQPSTFSNMDRCKYPLSATINGGSNNLEALSSNVAAALLSNKFNKLGFGSRLKSNYIFKVIQANKLDDCERACTESKDIICKSFNYRAYFPAENCELSQFDSKQLKLDSPQFYEQHTQYDFYERDTSPLASSINAINLMSMGSSDNPNYASECIEVSQSCSPDGMEFTLRTSEKFFGRIYTYGFYDSCYFDGNGGNVNVLKISRANGFPRCGTQQYSDAMTNIVVVQFNDFVQTSRDKKYNLTCYFSGPGEAVITSNYLDTKTDPRHPMQIESLPPQNILTSNVVLRVLYRGNPTNVIGVGDLLTFRLEAKSQYRYDFYNSDIFATNVIAKDPYTGRQVQLIDGKGCPADLYVFPELHKNPDGALEAEFYAFKLPDSNFLVFQATVRTCRGPCEPIICSDSGRGQGTFPSWGRRRRRRDVDEMEAVESNEHPVLSSEETDMKANNELNKEQIKSEIIDNKEPSELDKEEVHELLRVYSSRADIPKAEALKEERTLNELDDYPLILEKKPVNEQQQLNRQFDNDLQATSTSLIHKINEVCVTQVHYYSLLVSLILLIIWLVLAIAYFILHARRKFEKMKLASIANLMQSSNFRTKNRQFNKTTTEPKTNKSKETIYSDVSMVERPRSVSELQYGSVLMNIY